MFTANSLDPVDGFLDKTSQVGVPNRYQIVHTRSGRSFAETVAGSTRLYKSSSVRKNQNQGLDACHIDFRIIGSHSKGADYGEDIYEQEELHRPGNALSCVKGALCNRLVFFPFDDGKPGNVPTTHCHHSRHSQGFHRRHYSRCRHHRKEPGNRPDSHGRRRRGWLLSVHGSPGRRL